MDKTFKEIILSVIKYSHDSDVNDAFSESRLATFLYERFNQKDFTMRNQYSGKCFKCGKLVKKGEGFIQNIWSMHESDRNKYYGFTKWVIRCRPCKGTGNKTITK